MSQQEDLSQLRYVDFDGRIQTVSAAVIDHLDDFMPDSDMAPVAHVPERPALLVAGI